MTCVYCGSIFVDPFMAKNIGVPDHPPEVERILYAGLVVVLLAATGQKYH